MCMYVSAVCVYLCDIEEFMCKCCVNKCLFHVLLYSLLPVVMDAPQLHSSSLAEPVLMYTVCTHTNTASLVKAFEEVKTDWLKCVKRCSVYTTVWHDTCPI